ncbi:hypothetical protein [Corynebacterium suedekumii]|uniref:SMODS and SLOG-associating 2TM effector domain-containing protein n=1 Tax=Corynebacterium suedekumii TaxID=3049801 RepID=A0ABY8VPS1_9CORY|nr:hypothetical protein [Corynebacterium suedekumii]WIM70188.1 hypothetical protein QP029_13590 [Corynebacterium suedekumii]
MSKTGPQYLAALYEKRTYNTYLARIQMHQRLSSYRFRTRLVSAVLDTATILWIVIPASVVDYDTVGSIQIQRYVLIATALTALSISARQFIEYLNLDVRVYKASQDYVLIQALSQDFELLRGKPGLKMDEVKSLVKEYKSLLLSTENHLEKDFEKSNTQVAK